MIGNILLTLWGVISGGRIRASNGSDATRGTRRRPATYRLWQLAAALLLQMAVATPAFAQVMIFTGASPSTFSGPGQVITFSLKFDQSNAVTQSISLNGMNYAASNFACAGLPLAPNGSTTCTFTYTTTAANTFDITELGSYTALDPSNTPRSGGISNQQVVTYVPPTTAPGAPSIGTATAGNTQASVSFTAPASNGGSPITGYTATSTPGGKTGICPTSPCTVTGLTNGIAYTFTVKATNAVGTSAASAASNSVTPKDSQTLTFANPGTQNFATTPTLSATASSGLTPTFSSSTTGVCTITSSGTLTFVTAGTCTIDAYQAGNGSYLAAPPLSRSFTVNAVTPAAPTIGTATTGNGQASVTFAAPASNGGAAITGYTVTSSPGGITGSGSGSPLTVTGLTNGTAYTFTVTATNSVGTGVGSAASNRVTPKASQTITFGNPGPQNFGTTPTLTATASSSLTPSFSSSTTGVCTITTGGALTFVSAGTCTINANQAGNGTFLAAAPVGRSFTVNTVVPAAPTIGTATAGNGQASVSFTAPANTGGTAISSYTATSSPGGITASGSTSPLTVTGLTNGTAYTFTVTAANSAGSGLASAASNSVTPLAPVVITIAPTTPPSARVFSAYSQAFTASGGTAPYTYAIAFSSLPAGFSLSGSGQLSGTPTAIGLYNFTIRATDANSVSGYEVVRLFVAGPTISISPTTLPAATAGVAYSQMTAASGGTAPHTFASSAGALPAGLSLASNGMLSGTPTASGSFNFAITGTDSSTGTGPYTGHRFYALNVSAPTIVLPVTSLANGTRNSSYSASLNAASGGTAPYTYAVTAGALPAGITLATTGALSGTPTAAGTFNFTVTATDSTAGSGPFSATQTYTLTVADTVPVVGAVSASVAFNSSSNPITLNISGGTPTSVAIASAAAHGTATASGTSISYTPTAGYTGGDTFTYTATNASGTSSPATVTITVVAPAAPTVAAKSVSTAYNTSAAIDLSGSITGAGITAVTIGTAPAHGTVSVSGETVTYTPSSTYYGGSDSFTYTATNPGGTSAPATVSITVGLPAAPTAAPKAVNTPYNTAATIDLTSSITGAGITSVTIGTAPTHGTVSVAGETVTYTPSATYYGGSDSFTYTATNAGGTSAPATVSITVGLPAAPTAAAKAVSTPYNTAAAIDLTSSITGAGITGVTIGTAPTHGTVSVSGMTVTYTPSSTYYGGSDSFTYTATNPGGTSAPATVSITVGLPAAPTAAPKAVSTPYNTAASIDLTSSITGAGITSVTLGTAPTHGTVSVAGETVTYTPSATYYGGSDSFTYTATNPGGTSSPATVTITIGLPAAPTVANTSVTTAYNTVALIDLSRLISGVDISAVTIGTAPTHGTVSVSGKTVTYTPSSTFFGGSDSFTYTATNPGGTSTTATVTITVGAPAVPSVAAKSVSTAYNTAASIDLSGSITGVAISGITIVTAPTHGTVSVSGKTVIYTPSSTYYGGSDSFTYTATNPGGTSAPATVSITVTPLATPTAAPLSVVTTMGTPLLINATTGATGPMPLVGVSVATAPAHGSASVSGEQITYTPNAGFTGTDTFTYQVANNFGNSPPATITVSVTAEGQSGSADGNKTVVTVPGTPVTLNLADLVPGTYVSSAIVGFSPANAGSVVLSQPSTLTFTSTQAFHGLAQVSVVLTDSSGRQVHVNVLLLVTSEPDPSRNADVVGVINAQATAVQRFATSQLNTIQRRMESRRDGGGASSFSNTLSISRNGMPMRASGNRRGSADNPFRLYGQSNDDVTVQTRSGIGAVDVPVNVPVAAEAPVTDTRAGKQASGFAGLGVWIGGSANFGRYDAYQQAAGFDSVNIGINMGIDQQLGDKGLVGFSLGYNHDDSSIGGAGSTSIATGYSGSLYSSYRPAPKFYFDAVLGGGKLNFDSRRQDRDTGTFLTGHRTGDQWFGSLTAGYEYRNEKGMLWSPYLRLQQSLSHLDGFAETGVATAALAYGRQTVHSSLAVLGLRTSWQIKLANGVLVPNARLELGRDFQGTDDTTVGYAFIPSAGLWNVFANPYSANGTSAQAGFGFDLQLDRNLTWTAEFGYQHQPNANSQMIRFGMKKEF